MYTSISEVSTSFALKRVRSHAGIAAQPELAVAARLEVPDRVQLQLPVLGQAELLGALPRLAAVGRPLHRSAAEEVRARVERAVVRVGDRVVDREPRQQRALERPRAPVVASLEQEEPLARPDEHEHV